MFPNTASEEKDAMFPHDVAVDVEGPLHRAPPSTLAGKLHGYYAGAVERVRQQLASVRPWREFFDRQSFAPPAGLSDALSRLNRNVNQYYHNYVIMTLLSSSYVLLVNPAFSVCLLLVMAMWWYIALKRAEAAEMNCNYFILADRQITFSQAYLFLVLFGGISFFMTNGSSVLFWLILTSLGSVTLHAVMRKPSLEERPFSFV